VNLFMLTTYLNKRQRVEFRRFAKQFGITEYKLLQILALIFLENPKQYLPKISEKLKAKSKPYLESIA